MTSQIPPICSGCQHLIGDLRDPKCAAFPAGVPWPILLSQADHRKAYPDDRGIKFAPKDEDAAEYAALVFDDEGK